MRHTTMGNKRPIAFVWLQKARNGQARTPTFSIAMTTVHYWLQAAHIRDALWLSAVAVATMRSCM